MRAYDLVWICSLIASPLSVEAVTEIINDSQLFLPFRDYLFIYGKDRSSWLKRRAIFFHTLVSCGYCLSVSVSAFHIGLLFIPWFGPLFILWMTIHRISNIIHEGISRWFKRIPFVLADVCVDREEEVLGEEAETTEAD